MLATIPIIKDRIQAVNGSAKIVLIVFIVKNLSEKMKFIGTKLHNI